MRHALPSDSARVSIGAESQTGEDGDHGTSDVSTIVRPTGPPQPPQHRGLRSRTALLIGASVIVLVAILVVVTSLVDEPGRLPAEIDTSPQSAPKTEEQKVVESVEGLFKARDDAGAIPDPGYPLLAVYATGALLQADVGDVQRLKDKGLAVELPANSITEERVKVVAINGDLAQVEVCSIDDSIIVHAGSREPAYEYPPGFAVTHLYALEMVRQFDSWKVAGLTRQQRWEGVAGCAVGQP